MSEDDNYEPPEAEGADIAHAVARAGLGAIPYAGAAAIELFNAVVTPPLDRRRQEWMRNIGDGLRLLEERMGIILEDLQNNDAFIDAAMEASQIALRNSEQEKIEALRNAVLNAALPNPPEQSLQVLYLSYIDAFTVWHIRLLDLFQDPPLFLERHNANMGNVHMGSLSHLVETAFPELNGRREFYDLIWSDLYSRGLVSTDGLHVMMTGNGVIEKRTTGIGDGFLHFIKNPVADEDGAGT